MTPAPGLWPACGLDRLRPDAQGRLALTPDYVRLFLARPELALVPESCPAEHRLHEALQEDPLRRVPPQMLSMLQDADVRDNFRHFLAWRDALLAAGTLEAWYLQTLRTGSVQVPPVFIDLLVQAIVAHLLAGCEDGLQWRAAELLFRPQRVQVHQGRVLAADQEVIDRHSRNAGLGELGRLLMENQTRLREAELTVLDAGNAARYRERSERHDFLLDLTHEVQQQLSHGLTLRMARAHSGLKALARVLERWVQHFLAVEVRIEPLARVDDVAWRWHIGLDAEATAILNDLYTGTGVEEARMQRLISLFRLEFADPACMAREVAGKPVWLGLAMNAQGLLRLKPQNLLLNLPLAAAQ